MMTIKEYFETILAVEGYDAWEEANAELIDLVDAEELAALINEAELNLVSDWAKEHNVDLTAGRILMGDFCTYFQSWYWDNFED